MPLKKFRFISFGLVFGRALLAHAISLQSK